MPETYEQKNFRIGKLYGLEEKEEVIGLCCDLKEHFHIQHHDTHRLDRFIDTISGEYEMLPMLASPSNRGFFLMQVFAAVPEGWSIEFGFQNSEGEEYTAVIISEDEEVFEYTHACFELVMLEALKHLKGES